MPEDHLPEKLFFSFQFKESALVIHKIPHPTSVAIATAQKDPVFLYRVMFHSMLMSLRIGQHPENWKA